MLIGALHRYVVHLIDHRKEMTDVMGSVPRPQRKEDSVQ
jgi:hypothetical protein